MTPERLETLREIAKEGKLYGDHLYPDDILELLDYIDLLHEDLRVTRQERDTAKHAALVNWKALAKAEALLKIQATEIETLKEENK